jgi:hypothetical protein
MHAVKAAFAFALFCLTRSADAPVIGAPVRPASKRAEIIGLLFMLSSPTTAPS